MTKNSYNATILKTVWFFIVFFALSSTLQTAKAQEDDYIIVYKSHSQKQKMLKRQTFKPSRNFEIIPAVSARLNADQIKQLRKDPDIAYIEPDYKVYALGSTDSVTDSSSDIKALSSQTIPYGINMVNAPAVWPKTKGAGVRVAVLDTGISMYHPDRGNVVDSNTFVQGETVEDFDGHGTHTSGTVAAVDNDIGVIGVAPQAEFLIGKVLDNTGNGQISWLISGIEWAVDNNAKVISMSLGTYDYSAALETACNNAFAAGTLLVAAAGNENTSDPIYPAALGSVISVMAVDQNKNKASFSDYGPTVDIAAPGVSVYSTIAPIDSSNSTGATADAVWNATSHSANPLIGTAVGTAAGTICNCGLATGEDVNNTCPDSVAGNIAHIRRGITTFAAKVAHAQAKGAIGVIISNNVGGNFEGTLNDGSPLIVASITKADGNELQILAESGITGTVSVDAPLYAYNSGTSMACPHVSGVAALVFAVDSYSTTPSEVRDILFSSAEDLGDPGRDDIFGYGLVDVNAAIGLIFPQTCSAVWTLGYGLDGDIDHNCFVNSYDLQLFTEQWLISGCNSSNDWCYGGDIDHSGESDFSDLAKLAINWLICNDPQNINCN
jgi:subtilisin family serine protease